MIASPLVRLVSVSGFVIRIYEEVQAPDIDTVLLMEAADAQPGERALVLGCGAGLLALSLARQGALVTAVDISPTAVRATRNNGLLNNLEDLIEVRQEDLRDTLRSGETWDLLVANPPQLPQPSGTGRKDWAGQANDGGYDGRDVIRAICDHAWRALLPGGRLLMSHFDILDIERTTRSLRTHLRVEVSPPFRKQMGLLSFERREHFHRHATDSWYNVHVITAGLEA